MSASLDFSNTPPLKSFGESLVGRSSHLIPISEGTYSHSLTLHILSLSLSLSLFLSLSLSTSHITLLCAGMWAGACSIHIAIVPPVSTQCPSALTTTHTAALGSSASTKCQSNPFSLFSLLSLDVIWCIMWSDTDREWHHMIKEEQESYPLLRISSMLSFNLAMLSSSKVQSHILSLSLSQSLSLIYSFSSLSTFLSFRPPQGSLERGNTSWGTYVSCVFLSLREWRLHRKLDLRKREGKRERGR
jgi:hypothetical protein